MIVKPLGMT